MDNDAPDGWLPGGVQPPLNEQVAAVLLRALLSEPVQRRQLLAELIQGDSTFARWCRETAGLAQQTLEDLAGWLAARLPRLLSCSTTAESIQTQPPTCLSNLRVVADRVRRLEELEANFEKVVQRAKLDALKELAYGASHEINNPLANISMRAQSLIPGETDPERRRKLAQIHVQAMRAHEMIADLMLFARPPKPMLAIVDACAVAQEQVKQLLSRAGEQGTSLTLHVGPVGCLINADATQIGVALRALIINALEALGNGGNVSVRVQQAEDRLGVADPSPVISVSVADDGPGIPESVRPHLFDPFYSGREAGRGLGFGLTKAWRIATGHGGDLMHHPTPDGGATFVITLPIASGHSKS